ncbi:hypothetical protein ACIQU2_18220 [Pseudomonas sp. NPDC098740]|uniref:hypothetical protein n=1 Tax=Pseudomonas sp. NPDC098740 TaxID=3364486 RepID=UPI00383A156E
MDPVAINQIPPILYERRPTFSGSGQVYSFVQLVRADNHSVVLSNRSLVSSFGRWELSLNQDLPLGNNSIKVSQWEAGYTPIYSAARNFFVLRRTVITSPTANQLVASHEIVFRGETHPDARLVVVRATNHWNEFSPAIPAPGSGNWEAPLNVTLPSGDVSVQAQYIVSGAPLGYSDAVTFKVLGVPAISTPAASSEQEQIFTVTGNNGLTGAKVEIYKDALSGKVGESGVLTGANWTAEVTVDPGSQSLVALQKHSGKQSLRGAPRTFKVRPPQLSPITVTHHNNNSTVRLSGTGYPGALVHIHYSSNTSPPFEGVPVADNRTWSKDIVGLLPSLALYKFGAQQSVSDGGSGQIRSTGWTLVSVTVITPKPTVDAPTLSGQIPTFSGRRNVWGDNRVAIQITLNDAANPNIPDLIAVSGEPWRTTATGKIAPGSYTVKARQGVNNRWSEFTVLTEKLIIQPDLPELFSPAAGVETQQTVQFHGKTWPNAQVVVRFKNGEPIRTVSANGSTGEWSFNYTLPLGLVEVQVLSTFGGQTSEVKNQSFPVKTPPPTINFPTANNNEVPPKPVIEGTGIAGCWVHVYSWNTDLQLGRDQVGTDNTWKVTLDEQNLGDVRIYAKQIFNTTYASNETDALLIKVVVPSPSIEAPVNGTRPARTFTVSGEGGWPGGVIDLTLNGQPSTYKDIQVQTDGSWQEEVTSVVGLLEIKAIQRYKGVPSKDSLTCSVTVVPAVPVIDTPREGELMSETVVFSGFGYAGDSVRLYRRGLPFETHRPVPVSPRGTWSFPLRWAEPGKPFTVTVEQIAPGNYVSDMSPSRNFTLLSTAPTITAPVEGDWVGVRPEFSGLATPGATISVASWFDTANLLAPPKAADDKGVWKVTGNQSLPVGAAWVVVRQTLPDGTASEWAESGRFMVEE